MELDDLKKWFYVLVALGGITWYVHSHYTFRDALKLAKDRPHPTASPMIDYYVGMGAFIKEDYDVSIEAFNQLLADYPTSQYSPTAMYRLSVAYVERNRFQEAREILDKYFEEYPKDKRRKEAEAKYEYIKFK